MFKQKLFLLIFLLSKVLVSFSGNGILIFDSQVQIKARSSEKVFISFHKGDIINIEIKELKKRSIQHFSASEFEGRFIYELKKTHDSAFCIFFVPETSVYVLNFENKSFGSRNYALKIYRKPVSNNSKEFNTKPVWKEQIDTVYDIRKRDKIIAYDTSVTENPILVLDTCKNIEQILIDQRVKLESSISFRKKNRAVIEIDLAEDTFESKFVGHEPLAWAYWIGVGKEAEESWQKTVKTVSRLGGGLLSKYVHPLLGFAIGIIPDFFIPATGKNVRFWFVSDTLQSNLFLQQKEFVSIESGRSIVAYGKNNQISSSKIYLCLLNESAISPIDVNFKIASIIKECHYKLEIEKQIQIKAVYKRKAANIPKVIKRHIPQVNN